MQPAHSVVQALTLHTNLGAIKLELYCDATPKACQNFLALCASDYYNNTIFHRNIKGFMIQGGTILKSFGWMKAWIEIELQESRSVILFSKLIEIFLEYFDPVNTVFDN